MIGKVARAIAVLAVVRFILWLAIKSQ